MVVGQSDLVGDQHPTLQCSLNTPKHAFIQRNLSYLLQLNTNLVNDLTV